MQLWKNRVFKRALLTLAAGATAAVFVAPSAAYAYDESFTIKTTDSCGAADYVDYGPGAAGGGDNDDYVVIHDYCADSHGVRVWAWRNAVALGSHYNGNGQAGAAVIWDPYTGATNIKAGDTIQLEVCLVDGSSDTTGSKCYDFATNSLDG
jgi:hypothetical protein